MLILSKLAKNGEVAKIVLNRKWIKEIESGFIGNDQHPLVVKLEDPFLELDLKKYLPETPTFKLLLIESASIISQHKTLPIPKFRELLNMRKAVKNTNQNPILNHTLIPTLTPPSTPNSTKNYDNELTKNNCNNKICNILMSLSNYINIINKPNRFLINSKLVEIEDNLLIHKPLLAKRKADTERMVPFPSIFTSLRPSMSDGIQLTVNLKFGAVSPEENTELPNIIYILENIKNILKVYTIVNLDKESKIISERSIKDYLKVPNKFKPRNNISIPADLILKHKIKKFVHQFENNFINKEFKLFYYKHLYQTINEYIGVNNKYRKIMLNSFLKGKRIKLRWTYAVVLTKNDKGQNILNFFQFDHETGYIVKNINIATFQNYEENAPYSKENIELYRFILDILKIIKEKEKTKNISEDCIQLSISTLGYSEKINLLIKKSLLNILNDIKSSKKDKFNLIDITKHRPQECLQLFYIIYNNNPNISIDKLIHNYNALISKRTKTILNRFIAV